MGSDYFAIFFFFVTKGLMVWTKSRATSPDHQGSRDASSNPHHDRQSAPVMQTSFVHVQSMAATMAELTRQNQELRREINLRRQTHEELEGGGEDKHRVMMIEKALKLEVS